MITLKRTDGSIIAKCDTDNMAEAVVRQRADLCEANLRGADLLGANLQGADLRRAENILSIGPIGSKGRIIYSINHGDKIMVQAGCFWDDLEEFKQAVEEKHGDNPHGVAYRAAIEFILAYAKTYKWSEVKAQ